MTVGTKYFFEIIIKRSFQNFRLEIIMESKQINGIYRIHVSMNRSLNCSAH